MLGIYHKSRRVHLAIRLGFISGILLTLAAPTIVSAKPSMSDSEASIIERYRQSIPQLMAEQDIPGLAVAVVDDTRVLWVEGFGYTDDDQKNAINPDTIFSVQSTSKNFTAVAVLLAVQDGLLDLDTPITTYLPEFAVHSIFEEHPERKITLRTLLSHTAGFTHEAPLGNNFDLGPVNFEEHIHSISDTWLRFSVGTGYAYSNLGISLAGYILQTVSGQPFPDYVGEKLLLPLGMANSSFDMNIIQANSNRAVGHSGLLPHVPLEIPLVPEGGLYTSANDMAKYIQFHLNRGSVNGISLLNPALLNEMYTVPAPAEGSHEGYALGVARTQWHRGREAVLYSHGGGGFGFISDLWWLPELKIGITILTNSVDHNLQGGLALEILNDFVHDPTGVYFDRLRAIPGRTPVVDGDGGYRPPVGLAQEIEDHAMQHTDQDNLRWTEYIGNYAAPAWGVINPSYPTGEVYKQSSDLFLHIRLNNANDVLRLTEVEPGLFFAENGEALDFRGDIPTWRNIKLTRIGDGPLSWQWAILAVCAFIFLTTLLFPPLTFIIRRLRRAKSTETITKRWGFLASTAAGLSSLFGLFSIGMVVIIPPIIYSGFLGWMELPLWLRLLTHTPMAFLVTGASFLALNVLAWRNHWWLLKERINFLVFGLAFIVGLTFFTYWHLIGISLK